MTNVTELLIIILKLSTAFNFTIDLRESSEKQNDNKSFSRLFPFLLFLGGDDSTPVRSRAL